MIQQTYTKDSGWSDELSDELSDTDHYFCSSGDALALVGKAQETESNVM